MDSNNPNNPYSLKRSCLFVIRRNSWLDENKDCLDGIPIHLLLELGKYVSPYGLSLFEKKLTASCCSVDYLYLTQWIFPPSYRLKARVRKRRMIRSADDTVTNKQFFYNGLLNEVIEKMIYPHKMCIVKSVEQAWEYLLQYPVKYLGKKKSKVYKVNHHSLLLDMVSLNATCLTLTPSTVIPIINNYSTLSSILQGVRFINLKVTSISKNAQEVIEKIELIIRTAQDYNLSSVHVECIGNDFKSFNKIIESICAYKKSSSKDIKSVIQNDEDNFLEIYDFGYPSMSEGSDSDDDNIFNDVFKRSYLFNEITTQTIDTKINDFRLYSAELNSNLTYLFNKVSKWKSLEKLVICGDFLIDDAIISEALLALARFNNLRDLSLMNIFHEVGSETANALITLTKSSCKIHETRKCLEHLKVGICEFNLFIHLLQPVISTLCVDNVEDCSVEGLRSLEVILSCDDNLLQNEVVKSSTLRELKITKTYNEEDEDYLINCLSGISFHTFCISSEFVRSKSSPPRYLETLLKNTQLKHLALDSICNSIKFFNDDDENLENSLKCILSASKLTTLVWTNNGLGNKGLSQIAELIPYMPYLRFLDLGGNLFDICGVSVFLMAVHKCNHYFEKLSLGGPNVRLSDIKIAQLGWILEEYARLSLVYFMEMSPLEHVAQM